ncbi:hypothetical protein DPEC_G00268170 [Dallia pectoralis]|uniref:Uncharacterized protein n=1 Tax=Dallia pectoralis TaxID=75939 RepID=A0ACC2FNV1_DALPE|nr:hypothetical protein DPEC_G00268170 [Dallia pectoralis]
MTDSLSGALRDTSPVACLPLASEKGRGRVKEEEQLRPDPARLSSAKLSVTSDTWSHRSRRYGDAQQGHCFQIRQKRLCISSR